MKRLLQRVFTPPIPRCEINFPRDVPMPERSLGREKCGSFFSSNGFSCVWDCENPLVSWFALVCGWCEHGFSY
jgi:hypothetical protein